MPTYLTHTLIRPRSPQTEVEDALEKLMLGPKRDLVLTEERRRLTAYHEGGHALVSAALWIFYVLEF